LADGKKSFRYHWSWWIGGQWQAPGAHEMRIRAAGHDGPIAKLYVVTDRSTPDRVATEFVADFLPAINDALASKLAPK
jgi:hypothetical protein